MVAFSIAALNTAIVNGAQAIHFFLTDFLREAFGLERRLPPPH